eukprot:COSAG01_NODE_6107_length_3846_cov_1.891113_1_plen_378_part_00
MLLACAQLAVHDAAAGSVRCDSFYGRSSAEFFSTTLTASAPSEPVVADRRGIGFGWQNASLLLHARLKIHREYRGAGLARAVRTLAISPPPRQLAWALLATGQQPGAQKDPRAGSLRAAAGLCAVRDRIDAPASGTQTDKMVTCWPSLVLAIIVGSASASASSLAAAAATGRLPSLTELGSAWVDPNKEVSAAAAVGPEQRDLATINNFWGAGGIAPQTLRPVDLVAVNSLELPPYSGCGASMHAGSPSGFGCGRMLVDGVQVAAASTRWQSHEAGRRSAPLAGSSVTVESAMRMPFEQNGVIWEVNFTAAAQQAATIRIDFELAGMMNKRPTVGTWVYPTINTASSFNYTALADSGSGQKEHASAISDGMSRMRWV